MSASKWPAGGIVAAACLLTPVQAHPGHSHDAPPTLPAGGTLAAAFESAWQRAVAAREAAGQRSRAQAERVAAAAPWAAPPSLEVNHRSDRWHENAGRRENEIGIAWPLLMPGQRDARVAAADAAGAAAAQSELAARLRVAGEVRIAAWTLAATAAEAAQAELHAGAMQALARDVERRVDAGDLARADLLAARAEGLAVDAQRADAQQRLSAAQFRWTEVTGWSVPPRLDDDAPRAEDARDADALASHPELRAAALATEHARRRLAAAQTSRRDAPEVMLGYRREEPGRAAPSLGTVAIGLRIPLGSADRNQAQIVAVQGQADVAQAEEQRLRERLTAEIAAAREALRAAQRQHAAEAERAALLRERARLIEKSFRAGESPLPDLLRAQSAAAQAEAAAGRQHAALGLARARLQQSLGWLP